MTVQQRVEAYIRDWYNLWKGCQSDSPGFSSAHYEKWKICVSKLSEEHWVAACTDNGFGNVPDHHPEKEIVQHVDVSDEIGTVETCYAGYYRDTPAYFEYRLVMDDGNWRISSVRQLFGAKDDPPVYEGEKLESIMARVTKTPPLPAPELGDEPNCELLFKHGCVVHGTLMDEPCPIVVKKVGKLSLPSGAIVARDFGYSPSDSDAVPLSLGFTPGEYDVELCQLKRDVGAIRILFNSPGTGPFTYRRAVRLGCEHSSIGVDAGNVAICDARAYLNRNRRSHDKDYDRRLASSSTKDAVFLNLKDAHLPNAVVVSSGHGDGGYPAYWVFNERDELIALVVDFLVAAQFKKRTVRMQWRRDLVGVIFDESKTGGPKITVERGETVRLVVENGEASELNWYGRDGTVHRNGITLNSWHESAADGWTVDAAKLDECPLEMEVVFAAGFRNVAFS
jgi:hypothetical protein